MVCIFPYDELRHMFLRLDRELDPQLSETHRIGLRYACNRTLLFHSSLAQARYPYFHERPSSRTQAKWAFSFSDRARGVDFSQLGLHCGLSFCFSLATNRISWGSFVTPCLRVLDPKGKIIAIGVRRSLVFPTRASSANEWLF